MILINPVHEKIRKELVRIEYDKLSYLIFKSGLVFSSGIYKDAKVLMPHVLDIGCNTGEFGEELIKDKLWNLYGVDINGKALIEAKRKGYEIDCTDILFNQSLFNSKKFDYVIALEIIEHILNTEYFLRICKKNLKDNGILVISTPNFMYLRNRIELLLGIKPRVMSRNHIRYFTYSDLKELLEKNNFEIIKEDTSYFLFSRNRNKILGKITERIAKIYPNLLSSQIIYYVKKGNLK